MSSTVEVESVKQYVPSETSSEEPVLQVASLGQGFATPYKKTIELTHAEATRILELPEFVGDRVLTNSHVDFLTRQMEGGTFRWEQVQIITCRFEGREYRMNGQHSAWARLNMPEHGYRAPVTWLRYDAQTEHDMRQLYASIDRGKPRSAANVVISYLMGNEKFQQFNRRILRSLAEALAFWHWETDTIRALHTADDRSYLMLTDYYQLTTKVGNWLNSKKVVEIKHIFRRPCIAAMFATFEKAPEIALQFWNAVATGELLTKDDARMTLRNRLLTSSIHGGGQPLTSAPETCSSEEMFRWCILAWNFFRQGKPLKNLKVHLDQDRTAVR